MIFLGIIKNSRLHIYKKDVFEMFLSMFEGKEISVEVKKRSKKRTNKQNGYYWACLTYAARDLGYTPEELHDTFRGMYLTDHTQKLPLVKSTTRLNTSEFTEYVDKVLDKLSELNIIVPTPEEYYQQT